MRTAGRTNSSPCWRTSCATRWRRSAAPPRCSRNCRGDLPVLARIHGVIERQVAHMARLLDDLLDASRVASGKVALQRRPVAVAEFIDQAVETCRALIDAQQQLLTLDRQIAPLLRRWRPGAPGADRRQPAAQRGQVHAAGRGHRGECAASRRDGGDPGQRQRHGHRRRCAAARLRPVQPGGALARPQPGRPRHRPDGGARHGRAARRQHRRRQRRARPGQRVHAHAAAGRARRRTPGRAARRGRAGRAAAAPAADRRQRRRRRHARDAARHLRPRGRDRADAARRRSSCSPRCARRWWCATSACRA